MTRNQKLEEAISRKFSDLSPQLIDQKAAQFEYSLMEMYQIKKIHKTHIELAQLFNDKVFRPVFVDESIHPLLRKNDTFLLTLGLKGASWHVIYMSPPYYEEYV